MTESAGKKEVTVLCNLIVEVTPHHFCHVYSFGSAHTRGEGVTQGHEYYEAQITGNHFRSPRATAWYELW